MATLTTRKIVKIDRDKCNGCGLCVPSCTEGAIRIVDGKARLAGENLCDGLGNCLGECPRGAITIEDRPAEAFDEQAVSRARAHTRGAQIPGPCPGLGRGTRGRRVTAAAQPAPSQLRHWPVQLALVPEQGPMWDHAHLLLAADCAVCAEGRENTPNPSALIHPPACHTPGALREICGPGS